MRLLGKVFLVVSIAALAASVTARAQPSAKPRAATQPGAVTSTGPARSANEPDGEIKAVTQAILEEIDKRSELMANIEYLCDMIGPRLTGSPNLIKANEWTRDKFLTRS